MLSRLIPLILLLLTILCLLSGFYLSAGELQRIAAFLSQSGTSNPTLMAKVRLIPWLGFLSGFEFALLAALTYFHRKQTERIFSNCWKARSIKDTAWNGLLVLYGLVALLSLNFCAVNLTTRLLSPQRDSTYISSHGPKDYAAICSAILNETPPSARILIRTNRDEKYILNYDLYPRRLYFYPDKSVPVAGIPAEWLRKYRIEWILEIPMAEPMTFSLQRCQGRTQHLTIGAQFKRIEDGLDFDNFGLAGSGGAGPFAPLQPAGQTKAH